MAFAATNVVSVATMVATVATDVASQTTFVAAVATIVAARATKVAAVDTNVQSATTFRLAARASGYAAFTFMIAHITFMAGGRLSVSKNPPMLKKLTNGQANGSPTSTYAYEPPLMGAVLKQKAEALNLKPRAIAPLLNKEYRSIYKIYKRRRLRIPELFKWSEILGENLLLLIHPNIKPLPNPLQEEFDKLKALVKYLEGVEVERDQLKTRCIKLEAKIEVLEEQLKERSGR